METTMTIGCTYIPTRCKWEDGEPNCSCEDCLTAESRADAARSMSVEDFIREISDRIVSGSLCEFELVEIANGLYALARMSERGQKLGEIGHEFRQDLFTGCWGEDTGKRVAGYF